MKKQLISCFIFLSLLANTHANTFTVCASGCGYTTIASAIAAAGNGDTIYVNVNGSQTENGILINKSLTIIGNGKNTTFIQGAASRLTAADRIFNIPRTQSGSTLDDALTVTFKDITIRNGYASFQSAAGFSFGGGIQINNGNGTVVSFINVDFKNNDTRSSCSATCSNGGGAAMYISCTSGNATLGDNSVIINLTNCTFDDNNTGTAAANSSGSGQQGGAIQMNARGTLKATDCIFTNNTAFTSGGVMYNGAAIVGSFTNCVFENNNVTEPGAAGFAGSSFSGAGGAFGIRSSIFSFTSCSFKNNTSPSMGGAVWGGTAHTFTNCTFYGNSSQYGGAIYRMNGTANSTLSLINCTFAGNSASVQGRAIIVGNHSTATSSLYNIALINSIIANNSGAAPSDIFFATDYNRLTVNAKNYVSSFSGTGTAPVFDYNSGNATPGLASAPANNGGPIETILLDNTSTLENAGTNNVPGYTIPVKDARNYSRTDTAVDLGAYEKAGIIDDAVLPAITYTALSNSGVTTNRTLSVTITDVNGVYPWTSLMPRIYFKKGAGGTWQSTTGVLASGTGRNGTWIFTINTSLMGGVASGDQIFYYVIAQDVSTALNIASEPSGATASDVNTVTSPPSSPNSYLIAVAAPLTAATSQTNVSCNGGSNGSASVVASGGTPGYTYSWAPSGGTAATATGLPAGAYTCTITDGASASIVKSFTLTQPTPLTTSISSQTNIACNGGSNGSATVTASGGTPGYTYSWSPSGGTAATATDLAAGTYDCTIIDANSCSVVQSVTITQPILLTASTSQTNVTCAGGSTGMAAVTASGGTPGYTYSWSPSGGTGATASGLTAGDYTCTITDANLCSITKLFSITAPASTPGSNSYLLPTSNQTVIDTVSSMNYVTATCELVNTVVASGVSPVNGSVTNKVWIEGTVPTVNGVPFVQRHYEITPVSNASSATATVTLYFTQAEFDNFNAQAASTLHLPANPTDSAGKANLRIGKYSGISGDGTGLPPSYSGSAMVIDPDDSSIVWNAVSASWEVTFAVEGFSGLIVQTSLSVLPVTWLSFTVKKQNSAVILNWSTGAELNTRDFTVQHSVDGIHWKTVGIIAAAGNSSGPQNYTYIHNNTVKGYNYYRLIQTGLDGKTGYSEMKVIKLAGEYAPFTLVGNQVHNGVLQVQVQQATAFSLYDVSGRLVWLKRFAAGLQTIDVSGYAKGIYLLKTEEEVQKILIQ